MQLGAVLILRTWVDYWRIVTYFHVGLDGGYCSWYVVGDNFSRRCAQCDISVHEVVSANLREDVKSISSDVCN